MPRKSPKNDGQTYNGEVRRYEEAGRPKDIDGFVDYSDIKWSSTLKIHLSHCERVSFSAAYIRKALYRPFTKQALYYDTRLVDRPSSYSEVFPAESASKENRAVCVNMTSERPFVALATNALPESVCTAGFGSFSYVKSLLPDSVRGITSMFSTLRRGECILLGDSVMMPTRIKIDRPNPQPQSDDASFYKAWNEAPKDVDFAKVLHSWRNQEVTT
jgi:hypothetical protein